MSLLKVISQWKGSVDLLKAQGQMVVVLLLAYIGNNWPRSYPREENKDTTMFWTMNAVLLVAALLTLHHIPSTTNSSGVPRIQLLSREQTEEWKGWMQWVFIMYHYYRAKFVYNEIRVFVSAYVWMTGFGNFLYFDKKQDFSVERAISMWVRINYFPLLLSFFIGVPLDLFYIVPLHTTAFFITMATCYVAHSHWTMPFATNWPQSYKNATAIVLCLLVHIVFYETRFVDILLLFSKEIHFRFQADKYSAWVGIFAGFCWSKFNAWMQWTHQTESRGLEHMLAAWAQRFGGMVLMLVWYFSFGYMTDKFLYNPIHPYIFWIPLAGWLMVRNSSKYLTELHSGALEFFGRITLETYVLQFHVFMCRNVQNIPMVIPNSGPDGPWLNKTANMLLTGVIFVALAQWARHITVTTQTALTDLLQLLRMSVEKEGKLLELEMENGEATPGKPQEEAVALATSNLNGMA